MTRAARIGIMGGTFDPIHIAHLAIAEDVRIQLNLDKVLFIPAGMPAFKMDSTVSSPHHRLMMTQLATKSNPYFEVSDIEIERKGVTYTIDTVHELEARYPEASFFFIAGSDALLDIDKWRNAEDLAQLLTFVATSRPGYVQQLTTEQMNHLNEQFRIEWADVAQLDISSSMIRERIKDGRSIRYLVPPEVEEYMSAMGLYE